LADQCSDVIAKLGTYTDARMMLAIGGRDSLGQNAAKLKAGADIVTGTPGRIAHLIKKGILITDKIEILVLDEVDTLLGDNFLECIRDIFQSLPKDVQVVCVSATITNDCMDTMKAFMRDPVSILIRPEDLSVASIKQFYVDCQDDRVKLAALFDLYERVSICQSVIFVNTRREACWLSEELTRKHHSVSLIHSELSQQERDEAMRELRSGATRVLIATDILARGIDVQQISVVINFSLPWDIENYIHRIGRSGRCGRKGIAINLVKRREYQMLEEIQRVFKTVVHELPADFADLI